MRKWESNSEELTEMIKRAEESLSWEPELSCKATPTLTEPNIEKEDWTVSNSNNNVSEETVVKVMGVQWDRMQDNFDFDLATFSRLALAATFTKGTLLSSTARFYDPLGLLPPVILPLKCRSRVALEGVTTRHWGRGGGGGLKPHCNASLRPG